MKMDSMNIMCSKCGPYSCEQTVNTHQKKKIEKKPHTHTMRYRVEHVNPAMVGRTYAQHWSVYQVVNACC